MLSLATNPACLLMDDELNILPTSSHVRCCLLTIFVLNGTQDCEQDISWTKMRTSRPELGL